MTTLKALLIFTVGTIEEAETREEAWEAYSTAKALWEDAVEHDTVAFGDRRAWEQVLQAMNVWLEAHCEPIVPLVWRIIHPEVAS